MDYQSKEEERENVKFQCQNDQSVLMIVNFLQISLQACFFMLVFPLNNSVPQWFNAKINLPEINSAEEKMKNVR